MSWFILALISPLLFAIINLIDDHMLKHVYRSPHSGAIVSSLFAGLPLLSVFFLDTKPISLGFISVAVFTGFMASVLYYNYFRSFEDEPPSIIAAVLGTSPLILSILGYLFLNERLSLIQIVGGAIVLSASILLVLKKEKKYKLSNSFKHLLFALLALSAYTFLSKFLYNNVDFYTAYMFITTGVVLGGLFFIFYLYFADRTYVLKDLKKSFRKFFPIFLVTELLAITAEVTSSIAISKGPVSIVKSIENIQPMYVLLLAICLHPFKPQLFREVDEGNIIKKIFLMIVIIFGLYLIGSSVFSD